MRIAQVAPLVESVPPRLYGGTERIVSYLTESLVDLGHEVTLFASGDSQTRARLVPGCPLALWRDPTCREVLPHHARLMSLVFRDTSAFDVIHFHSDCVHFPMLRVHPCANVTTLHGQILPHDLGPLLTEHAEMPLVSISQSQRRPLPDAHWLANIPHGLPRDLHHFDARGGGHLAFVGRMAPEKGADRAIEVALRAGIPLKIGARVPPEQNDYFEGRIRPLLKRAGRSVEFVGEIGEHEKGELLRGALATLFTIDWEEPFGLVMIESLACGTPVIGWRRGSVPEVIEHGVTGFIVGDLDEAVRAVGQAGRLDRRTCRDVFEKRFDAVRMTREYIDVYRRVQHSEFAEPRLRAGAGR